MADAEDESKVEPQEEPITVISKRSISESVNYENKWFIQKFLYYILYPLIRLLDINIISKREYVQIPLITYAIEVTQLMIAIAFVELHIQGLETRASLHNMAAYLAILYIFIYTLIIFLICIISLYILRKFTRDALHYNYFVELSTNMVGYGLLYAVVLVQYEWFSSTSDDAWSWFLYLFLYACLTIAVVILIKQCIFNMSMIQNIMKQYELYSNLIVIDPKNPDNNNNTDNPSTINGIINSVKSEMVSLIENRSDLEYTSADDDADDLDDTQKAAYILFDEPSINELQHEMDDTFWYTIFTILTDMWPIALGFILVECVVYEAIDKYVNLLVRWQEFRNESAILDNAWLMVLFGLFVAVCTCLLEGTMELTCKIPCYRVVKRNIDYTDFSHRCLVFSLNWINDISVLWMSVLAACIGWCLMPPNQTEKTWSQFQIALLGTFIFIGCGILAQKYKIKKERNILNKMQDIREDEEMDNAKKEKKLLNNVRNLIFYNKIVKMYNAAFAVSVSFAWETFIQLALADTTESVGGLEDDWETLMFTIIYVVIIGPLFTELGILLTDLRKQRLKEARAKIQQRRIPTSPSNSLTDI